MDVMVILIHQIRLRTPTEQAIPILTTNFQYMEKIELIEKWERNLLEFAFSHYRPKVAEVSSHIEINV